MLTDAIAYSPGFFEASRKKRKPIQAALNPIRVVQPTPQAPSPDGPEDPRRRRLMELAMYGGATAAFGGLLAGGIGIIRGLNLEAQKQKVDQAIKIPGLEGRQNSAISSEVVIEIGSEIEQSDLPGFNEAGKLITLSQTDPNALTQYLPLFSGNLEFRFGEILRSINSVAHLAMEGKGDYKVAEVKEIATGRRIKTILGQYTSVSAAIEFDNSLINASKIVTQLMFVKEISHFLYTSELRSRIAHDVLRKYDVTIESPEAVLQDILFYNSVGNNGNIPSLGELFDFGLVDLDGAGYFHIVPSYGLARAKGILTPKDIKILESNERLFEIAKSKGLLKQNSDGTVLWKQGIGPFSPEWTEIIRSD